MPHSFLFGHILVIAGLTSSFPQDIHPNYMAQLIMEHWKKLFPGQPSCPGVLYVDMWPLAPPIAFTVDGNLAAQILQDTYLPKAKNAMLFLQPLTGNLDIGSLVGPEWKLWRSRFNPGFSAKNVTGLIPAMLDEVITFTNMLKSKTGPGGTWGQVFRLEERVTNLTMDVIGRAVL
jgi:cytochrome P450